MDFIQINANPAIENSVIKVIEKDKPESTGENKLSLTETCSSLLDIHSWNLDIGITIKNKCIGIIIKNKCNKFHVHQCQAQIEI